MVCWYLTTNFPGDKALIHCICQVLWCNYSHQCQFQATKLMSLNTALGRDMPYLLSRPRKLGSSTPLSQASAGTIVHHSPSWDSGSQPRLLSATASYHLSPGCFLSPLLLALVPWAISHSSLWTSVAAFSWTPTPRAISPCCCQGELSGSQIWLWSSLT